MESKNPESHLTSRFHKAQILKIFGDKQLSAIQVPWILFFGFLLILLVFFCRKSFLYTFYPFGLQNGEGLILRYSLLVSEGKPLYLPLSQNPPFIGCNYPPFFMILTALPLKLMGASFLPGRLISILSRIGIVLLIFGICRRLGGDRLSAAIGALFYLMVPTLNEITLNRAQMLAVFLSLSGIFLLMPKQTEVDSKNSKGAFLSMSDAAGIACLALGTFTKQTAILAPAAYFFWVLLWKRDRLSRTIPVLLAAGLLLHGGLTILTDGNYFLWVASYSSSQYSADRFFFLLNNLFKEAYILIIPASILLLLESGYQFVRGIPSKTISKRLETFSTFFAAFGVSDSDSGRKLLSIYFIIAICSLGLMAKKGSSSLYWLEPLALMSVFTGMLISYLRRWCGAGISKNTAVLSSAILLFAIHFIHYYDRLTCWNPQWLLIVMKDRVVLRVLEDAASPILAEEHAYTIKKDTSPYLVNTYIYSDLARRGKWNPARIIKDLETGRIGAVCLNSSVFKPFDTTSDRFSEEILNAVRTYYPFGLNVFHRFIYLPTKKMRDKAYQKAQDTLIELKNQRQKVE